ncbi:unnamed protein product [Calypogeia fissa]
MEPLPEFDDISALCNDLKAFYTRRKPVASTTNTLARALYTVFMASSNEAMTEMRRSGFQRSGGVAFGAEPSPSELGDALLCRGALWGRPSHAAIPFH